VGGVGVVGGGLVRGGGGWASKSISHRQVNEILGFAIQVAMVLLKLTSRPHSTADLNRK